MGVDLLALSAHKFNGPKGAGALWIKRGTRMLPILTGGKHERNRRAGTENTAAIAGLGEASQLGAVEAGDEHTRLAALRDRLEQGVARSRQRHAGQRLTRAARAQHDNISFDRVEAESLLIALDLEGIAVSTGSACSSGTLEPSHVLRAMGFRRTGRRTRCASASACSRRTRKSIASLEVLPRLVDKLRALSRGGAR